MKYSYYPGCTLRNKAKDLDEYARASARALGFELEEIEDWQCCGGVYPLGTDEIATKLSSVRALNQAKEKGQDLVTICSACHHVIKRVNDDMKNVEDIRTRANNYMQLDEPYEGETTVLHYLEVLRDKVGFDKLKEKVGTESLDINYPSLEEQNPELYKQYLQALRDYKAGEHKVVFVSMDNTTSAPAQRNEHLTTMPDSVDIICLMNPDNLHPTLAGEFAKVREKGTRVIYNIDYNAIEKLWEKVLADEEANKPEEPAAPDTPEATQDEGGEGGGEGEPTPEEELELRFLEFCRQQTVRLF